MRDDYNTLVAEAGYLYDLRLSLSTIAGVTVGDLESAQEHARAVIDKELAGIYCNAAWVQETPAIIERIADMLSSAEVLAYAFSRGFNKDADTHLPNVLKREGLGLLKMVREDRLSIVGTGGEVQPREEAADQ